MADDNICMWEGCNRRVQSPKHGKKVGPHWYHWECIEDLAAKSLLFSDRYFPEPDKARFSNMLLRSLENGETDYKKREYPRDD
jgi:hypothetical protein